MRKVLFMYMIIMPLIFYLNKNVMLWMDLLFRSKILRKFIGHN